MTGSIERFVHYDFGMYTEYNLNVSNRFFFKIS